MTLAQIKTAVALVMNKAEADFTVSGTDLFLFAINQVRRDAETLYDFEFTRKLVNLEVDGVTGGSLDDVTLDGYRISSLTVTGTLSLSDLVGTYNQVGFVNDQPFYIKLDDTLGLSGVIYWEDPEWVISPMAYWGDDEAERYALTAAAVTGTYTAENGATGSPVVAVTDQFTVKGIIDIGVYDDDGNLRPSEWTTVSEGLERQRKDNDRFNPRYPTDAQVYSTPSGIGRFEVSGNQIYAWPKSATDDFSVGIEVYTFSNDWTTTTNIEDIWTKYGHKYLVWGTVVFLNHRFKTFVYRQEGNLPPPEKMRDEGLRDFVEWDSSKYESNRRHSR